MGYIEPKRGIIRRKSTKAETKAAPAEAAAIDITVPVMGESVAEGSMGKWLKKSGDAVKKDELLVELETDKVSLEVVAPADGVLGAINAAEGDTAVPGTVLGSVTEGGAAAAAPAAAAPAKAAKAETKAIEAKQKADEKSRKVTPANIKRYLTVARLVSPVVAPLAYRGAVVAREQLNQFKATRAGVAPELLAQYSGHGAPLSARIESARGVGQVTIEGASDRAIQIDLDAERARVVYEPVTKGTLRPTTILASSLSKATILGLDKMFASVLVSRKDAKAAKP